MKNLFKSALIGFLLSSCTWNSSTVTRDFTQENEFFVDLNRPKVTTVTQSKIDRTPPVILLHRALKKITTSINTVQGKVIDHDSGVSSIKINGMDVDFNSRGEFKENILLEMGNNSIVIIASDYSGNISKKVIRVKRERKQQKFVSEEIVRGKYYAVLIGVEEYQDSYINDLDQPIGDVQKFKEVLKGYSFDRIITLENPSRKDIVDGLDRISNIITPDDNLLIFYAGHGYWDNELDQGYWLPSDSAKRNRSQWLSNSTIRDYIRGINSKHTLLISDACFSGGIFKTRSAFNNQPYPLLYHSKSRKAITSGELTVPDESVFLDLLIKSLNGNQKQYISSNELFSSFKDEVIENSLTNQIPQFGEIKKTGDEGGDFIFIRE